MAPGRPERNYDVLTVTQDDIRELAEYRRAERIMLERHLEPEVWLAEPGAPWGVDSAKVELPEELRRMRWPTPTKAILAADEWLKAQEGREHERHGVGPRLQ